MCPPKNKALLYLQEGVEHDRDGDVDVVVAHVVAEVHLGVRLREADDGLDVPHRDGHLWVGWRGLRVWLERGV